MKSLFIFFISLLCLGGLIGFWRAKQTPSEVLKIYKAGPYEPKSTRVSAVENVHPPAGTPVAKTRGAEYSDGIQTNEALSKTDEFIPEEGEFGEWLTSLDTELSVEALSGEREDIAAPEIDTAGEIPYSELEKMVADAYEMEDVLNAYDIYVNKDGRGHCPKCAHSDFYLLRSVAANTPDEWCCMDCEYPGGNVTDFVAWIERIDVTEATQYLAERAGLLESGQQE